MNKQYFVYIATNPSKTLYIGITNDLDRRVYEHKKGIIPGFTRKYHIKKLVYYEEFIDVNEAIAREKELKGWRRSRKIELIENINSSWKDLYYDLV